MDKQEGTQESKQSSQRTPFTQLEQVASDLALAITLQEQERAFTMLETIESESEEELEDEESDYGDSYDGDQEFIDRYELEAELDQVPEGEGTSSDDDMYDLEEFTPDALSYEEMIALGEFIGEEKKGLEISEIPTCLHPCKCQSVDSKTNIDRCVICQVEYEEGGFFSTVPMATNGEEDKASKTKKEGTSLLGAPSFTKLDNGRFKCVETGHEMLAKDKDSYSNSKRCRLGLIDFALSKNKPPLNIFKQDPLSRSKLICKLTGDTINKSEEHIWKHINGKRFLNKLEEKETGKPTSNGTVEEKVEQKPKKASKQSTDGLKKKKQKEKKKKKKEKEKEKEVEEIISEVRNMSDNDSGAEEDDFWVPPVGDRWDFDDGGDRWGSGSESGQESDEVNETDDPAEEGEQETEEGISLLSDGPAEEVEQETEELSTRTKRMSIEIGPSSFASRKKKSKKNHTN